MKIYIIHDSEKGNGKTLAEKLASELEAQGSQVKVGHRTEISPEDVASDVPDLLIVGAAVRKFVTSPPVKRWITRLIKVLNSQDKSISHVAVFLTHVMPDDLVRGRVSRLQRSLTGVTVPNGVYTDWLSGQVKNIPGPFVDGVLEKAVTFAAELHTWAQSDS